MQEEVSNKTVNVAVVTSKLSAKTLMNALMKYLNKRPVNNQNKKGRTGKMSVKELSKQGQGLESMEILSENLREFKKIANKYGVDFAITKEKSEGTAKYIVFFKAKDREAIELAVGAGVKRFKNNDKDQEKPSVREKLRKYKDIVAKQPRKVVEKIKENFR